MRDAMIVSSVRTAVGKALKGSLRSTRPDDLAAVVIKEAIARTNGLEVKDVEDVILGCAMPEAEQGMNVARNAWLRAGLPVETSAMTINRFCSSGLQSIALGCGKNHGRARRSCSCGRHRVDVHGAHGGQQSVAESLVDGPLPGSVHQHGVDG